MLAPIGGVFYPKGHAMVMYPSEAQAREVADRLLQSGFSGDQIHFVPGATVLEEIAPTVAEADSPLPSVGSEAGSVRTFAQLAREGHAGLLVRCGNDDARSRMQKVLEGTPHSVAKYYRTWVIEDL